MGRPNGKESQARTSPRQSRVRGPCPLRPPLLFALHLHTQPRPSAGGEVTPVLPAGRGHLTAVAGQGPRGHFLGRRPPSLGWGEREAASLSACEPLAAALLGCTACAPYLWPLLWLCPALHPAGIQHTLLCDSSYLWSRHVMTVTSNACRSRVRSSTAASSTLPPGTGHLEAGAGKAPKSKMADRSWREKAGARRGPTVIGHG